jgi:hypothetical protein
VQSRRIRLLRTPPCNQPSGPIIAWVKYGPNVTMAEALTQDYVARFLIANPAAGVRVPRVYAAFSRHLQVQLGYRLHRHAVYRRSRLRRRRPPAGCNGCADAYWTQRSELRAWTRQWRSRYTQLFLDWTSPITYETVDELSSILMA